LFVYLQRNPRADHYKEEDLPSNISLSEVTDFLRSLPCHKAELVPCGSETLDESMIKAVEISVEVMLKDKVPNSQSVMAYHSNTFVLYCIT
jgi:hypothetical protein